MHGFMVSFHDKNRPMINISMFFIIEKFFKRSCNTVPYDFISLFFHDEYRMKNRIVYINIACSIGFQEIRKQMLPNFKKRTFLVNI